MYVLNYYVLPIVMTILLLIDLVLLLITLKMIGANKRFQRMMKEEMKRNGKAK